MAEAPKRIFTWQVGETNGEAHGSWADINAEIGPNREMGTPFVRADIADGYREALRNLVLVYGATPASTDADVMAEKYTEAWQTAMMALAKGDEA